MPRRGRKHGSKAEEVVSCPGYVDEHGQWNNGFHCPKWGGPDQAYCCGTETHLYCCPKPEDFGKPTGLSQHVPLVVGVSVGCVVLMTTSVILTCYFCRCCWAYKRRKTRTQGVPGCSVHGRRSRGLDYAVNYSVCPHQAYPQVSQTEDYPDLYGVNRPVHLPMYPLDDPPPYPGEPPYTAEEKQPLNPSDLVVMTEGPDDTPVTVAVGRGVGDALFLQDLSARGQTCMPHSLSGVSPFEECEGADSRPNLATSRFITPSDSRCHDDRSPCTTAALPSLGNGRYTTGEGKYSKPYKKHQSQRHINRNEAEGSDVSSPEDPLGHTSRNGHNLHYHDAHEVASSSNRHCVSHTPHASSRRLPSTSSNSQLGSPSSPVSLTPQG